MTTTDTTQVPSTTYDGGTYLALRVMHGDTRRRPDECRAANSAMDAIDRALCGLQALRSHLVFDICQSDNASATRVAVMLPVRYAGDAR